MDVARAIQRQTGLSFGEAESLVEELLGILKNTLESGESVMISDFGKFEIREKRKRPGRNPRSGREHPILARKVGTFTSSKAWRNSVNTKE